MSNLSLTFPKAAFDPGFSVRHLDVSEALSRPFEITILAASPDPDLDFALVIGERARVAIDRGPLGARAWTGVCASVEQLDAEPAGLSLYMLRVVPSLWLLGGRRGHRSFQHLSTPAIARKLLAEWHIDATFRLDESRYPEHELRVQYGETDLAFLDRLLEDANISHFFEQHEAGDIESRLVLTDAPQHGELRAAGPIAFSHDPSPASQNPYLTEPRLGGDAGSGGHHRTLAFETNVVDLAPGDVFSVKGSPRPEMAPDQRLCVIATRIEAASDAEWSVSAEAAFASGSVRPARRASRPRISGVQSAVVVGPPGHEIHVDDLGRVRIRFHWDREGAAHEETAPWVRVSEGWAGAGFGMIMLPRVGQEVLVGFVEGDPDQPIVVGRAYDASAPAPHALPAARATSAWRSRSSPDGSGYNEIAFDDRHRHELLSLRAERDLEKVVEQREVEKIGEDRGTTVEGRLLATVAREDVVTAGDLHVTRVGDTRREIAARRITLTTGASTIVLDGPDITVTAKAGIRIAAGGTVSIQGEPYVHLNPPQQVSGGAHVPAPEPEHLVWFKLVSEGMPLAGARCHVEHEDGTSSVSHTTDANGLVRLPVDGPGNYHLALGAPRSSTAAARSIPVGKTPAQSAKKAKPTEHDVPISIHVVEPRHDTTFHLHSTPSMPKIPFEARVLVQGEPVDVGHVRWEMSITGKYRVRSGSSFRQQHYRLHAGHVSTRPGEEKRYELEPPALVGGALHIKAVFHGGPELGGVTASRAVKGCKVLGKNPPRHEVEAFIVERGGHLAWLFLRMFCHESAHTLEQYARGSGGGNTPGQPLYGPPSGVGIVQRDPVEGEWHWPKSRITRTNNFFPRIFWNWEKNLEEGIHSFKTDYIERGRSDLESLRHNHPHLPAYPEGVLMRAAIRRYNGGIEFGASGDGRHYVVSPTFTNNPGYVNDVLNDPHIDAEKHPVPAAARATVWPH